MGEEEYWMVYNPGECSNYTVVRCTETNGGSTEEGEVHSVGTDFSLCLTCAKSDLKITPCERDK